MLVPWPFPRVRRTRATPGSARTRSSWTLGRIRQFIFHHGRSTSCTRWQLKERSTKRRVQQDETCSHFQRAPDTPAPVGCPAVAAQRPGQRQLIFSRSSWTLGHGKSPQIHCSLATGRDEVVGGACSRKENCGKFCLDSGTGRFLRWRFIGGKRRRDRFRPADRLTHIRAG